VKRGFVKYLIGHILVFFKLFPTSLYGKYLGNATGIAANMFYLEDSK